MIFMHVQARKRTLYDRPVVLLPKCRAIRDKRRPFANVARCCRDADVLRFYHKCLQSSSTLRCV